MEAKTRAHATPSHVDFEPTYDWRKEDRSETLVLYLPEFKKKQLKVQISNMKTLKISGERHVDETRSTRFRKTVTIPRHCNVKQIHAIFVDGLLEIKMPKENSFSDPKQEQFPNIEQTSDQLADEKSKMKITQDQSNNLPNSLTKDESAIHKIGIPINATKIAPENNKSQSLSRFKCFSMIAMNVAVAMAVVAGFGALTVYSCLFLLS